VKADSATRFARLASLLYETLLVFAVVAVTVLFPHMLFGMFGQRQATPAVLWAHLVLVLLLYFVWFWRNGGQTLAMRTWRIRLASFDGRRPQLWQLLIRFAAAWPSIGLIGIGILWSLLDRDGQFLHDRLAGTRLIRAE
jgi:uncharacterized RDD family membrane protein YckC